MTDGSMHQKVREALAFIDAYCKSASQLATEGYGLEFWRMGIPVAEAIAWASQGYTPGEARIAKAEGVTPELDAEISEIPTGEDDETPETAEDFERRLTAMGIKIVDIDRPISD